MPGKKITEPCCICEVTKDLFYVLSHPSPIEELHRVLIDGV